MSKTIKPDQLTETISKMLEEFQGATEEVVEQAVKETAKEAVGELRMANPSGSGKYGSWTKYANSWDSKDTTGKRGFGYTTTIYNKKFPWLPHLLEFGHAVKGGGRSKAFPHIAPVAEKAEENLIKNIKRRIK